MVETDRIILLQQFFNIFLWSSLVQPVGVRQPNSQFSETKSEMNIVVHLGTRTPERRQLRSRLFNETITYATQLTLFH